VLGDDTHCLQTKGQITNPAIGDTHTFSLLIDSGATNAFINQRIIDKHGWQTNPLPQPVTIYNADRTPNQRGQVLHTIDLILRLGEHQERMTFAVAGLGRHSIIIGHSWLKFHNPKVDWTTRDVRFTQCPPQCWKLLESKLSNLPPSWATPKLIWEPDTLEVKTLLSQEDNDSYLSESKIPIKYSNFNLVFSEKAFKELPP
jgi:predicted aspartyl protease